MSPKEKRAIERNMKLRCFFTAFLIYAAVYLCLLLVFLLADSIVSIHPYVRLVCLIFLLLVSFPIAARLCNTKRITDLIYWR